MTFHFPDQVDTNVLTIDATDPRSGTAEFKATAIRVEKLPINGDRDAVPAAVAAGNGDRVPAAGNGDGAGRPQDVRA
jgi:formate dehydrogenase major subunit